MESNLKRALKYVDLKLLELGSADWCENLPPGESFSHARTFLMERYKELFGEPYPVGKFLYKLEVGQRKALVKYIEIILKTLEDGQ